MEIILKRMYFPKGTNGRIFFEGKLQCYSIELPWLNNQHEISCIPEGAYKLSICYSKRLGEHFMIHDVPLRSEVLIHAANDALHELKGCIAPVSELSGEGSGNRSRAALEELLKVVKANYDGSIILKITK